MGITAPTLTREVQATITPEIALTMLQEGNQRFINGTPAKRDIHAQIRSTAEGQYPFAVVQGCIDSRAPLETIFDTGVGDIFVSRVAGNVINTDQLGGMEYACKVAGSRLVVVMGHTRCGAVSGAINGVELGNLSGLLGRIRPAVRSIGPFTTVTPEVVEKVVEANVRRSVQRIRDESAVLNDLEDDGAILIVGAVYDIETGKVRFLD